MIAMLQSYKNLRLVEASVEDIALVDPDSLKQRGEEMHDRSAKVKGVMTKDGGLIEANRVVITTGTFLRGIYNV